MRDPHYLDRALPDMMNENEGTTERRFYDP